MGMQRSVEHTCTTREEVQNVIVAVCPACGYPTIGPDLCAFCRDVVMLTDRRDVRAETMAEGRYLVDRLG